MTDAHCHVSCGDPSVRELLVGRDFFGVHPWETLDSRQRLSSLRSVLLANPHAGVGEIGLDRLKCRDIPPLMREVFEAQLALAFELGRPVVLHGAKCWGQVVKAIVNYELRIMKYEQGDGKKPPFLFHGFSRSDGLIPDIVKLGGFISVGPAVLNDHAVNYRELVKKIPLDRLLVETDRTEGTGETGASPSSPASPARPLICDVLAKTAELRGISAAELERITDENSERFFPSLAV
jgi:TatD DNase family protein